MSALTPRSLRSRTAGACAGGAGVLAAALVLSLGAPASTSPLRAGASDADGGPGTATAVSLRSAAVSPRVVHSTFLGGRQWDEGNDVEVDRAGNTYVTGFTLSPDFPLRPAGQRRFAGLSDAFVTKHAPDGRVLWSRLLGGRDLDVGSSLALDEAGSVYVTGRTASPDFPTTPGALKRRLRARACQGEPCHDAFVSKLSPRGTLLYSTLLGGSGNEEGVGIAVDRAGNASVTGNTDSHDFPTRRAVQSRFQSPPCPGDLPCPYDVFVATLTTSGGALRLGSYLGGNGTELSGGIAVDRSGAIYVTGTTRSSDFPVSSRALQPTIAGRTCGPPPHVPCLDAFVTKITPGSRGSRLTYSTYFGGSSNERAGGVAVDAGGRAVITGSTQSSDLPRRRAWQGRIDNAACTAELPEEQCDDAFVAELDRAGRALVYSTYLGGRAEDQGLAVTVDARGDVLVAGRTDSRDFPARAAAQPAFGGYIDGFLTRLRGDTGSLVSSTFLGGRQADRILGVDTHPSGTVHVTGRTLSPDFPTRPPSSSRLHGIEYDATVTVLR